MANKKKSNKIFQNKWISTIVIVFILFVIFLAVKPTYVKAPTQSNSTISNESEEFSYKSPDGWWINKPFSSTQEKNVTTVDLNPFSMEEGTWDWGPAIRVSSIKNTTIKDETDQLFANLKEIPEPIKNETTQNLNIDGRNAIKLTYTQYNGFIGKDVDYIYVFIQNSDDVYIVKSDNFRFESKEQQEQIINDFISTFKFMKSNNVFCGGITNKSCAKGYYCKIEGKYTDAGGKCIKQSALNKTSEKLNNFLQNF